MSTAAVIYSLIEKEISLGDVITLMGHYTSVAMTLAFYDVPDGATGMER